MEKLAFLGLVLVGISGCQSVGARVGAYVVSNVPYHRTDIAVINNSNDLVMKIERLEGVTELQAGERCTVSLWNLSGYGAEAVISARIYDQEGKFIGTAARTFYISGQQRRDEIWAIGRRDIYLADDRRSSW